MITLTTPVVLLFTSFLSRFPANLPIFNPIILTEYKSVYYLSNALPIQITTNEHQRRASRLVRPEFIMYISWVRR